MACNYRLREKEEEGKSIGRTRPENEMMGSVEWRERGRGEGRREGRKERGNGGGII